MYSRRTTLVIGAGVSGLTTAICLAEAGFPVRVITRDAPADTTSFAAGAIWGPYLFSDDRVLPWSDETRQMLCHLSGATSTTGVRRVHGLEAARTLVPVPRWAAVLPKFRVARSDELPPDYRCGWWYEAPLVDMPVYLSHLTQRLLDLGVKIERAEINALDELADGGQLIVNCTGVGAAKLTEDTTIVPVRGQLVVVENPGIDWFFAEHDESPTPTYFLPHGDHLVLGGSIEPGLSNFEPDLEIADAIRARCAVIDPRLATTNLIAHRVGMRPSRPTVRLEHERLHGTDVIHNYGHGGAGVTVSWGCGRSAVELAKVL